MASHGAAPAGAASRPIVLVGMMGSGKSTVGRRLAARLHPSFVDAAKVLEERGGGGPPPRGAPPPRGRGPGGGGRWGGVGAGGGE